jgi:hypothetical protein
VKLNELEFKKWYRIKFLNSFAALEILNNYEGINVAWENFKRNIKNSATKSLGIYGLKQHKTYFDEECLRFLDQRKQVKKQWLEDQNQINIVYSNNIKTGRQ